MLMITMILQYLKLVNQDMTITHQVGLIIVVLPYLLDTGSEPNSYKYYSKKFLCPKATYALSEKQLLKDRPYELRLSYGMNTSNLVVNKASQLAGAKFTQLNDPSTKILFSDSISEILQVNAEYGKYLGGNYENPENIGIDK